MSIEDTLLPRAFGSGSAAQLLSIDEGAGKMRAAIAARRDPSFVIVGRTSATALSGVDDAIARLRAYEAAGVDALMIPGLKSRDELDRIASATSLPLVVGGMSESMCDPVYLASRRARLWSGGHHTFNVAVKALHDAMKAVHGGVLASKLSGAASKELMDDVTDAASYADWIGRFLGGRSGRDN